MGGERQQSGLLVGPDVGDGAVSQLVGVTAVRWAVSSRQRRNWALRSSRSRKGRAAKKACRRYWICRSTFPLFVSAAGGAGSRREVIVPGELEQAGVELDGGAAAVEHRAAEVVVHEGARDAAEGFEGFDVSAQEALEGLVEGEQRGDGARVAEDHDEAGDGAGAVSDADLAERAPVDLRGLARPA